LLRRVGFGLGDLDGLVISDRAIFHLGFEGERSGISREMIRVVLR
jgi:hypothetical protein